MFGICGGVGSGVTSGFWIYVPYTDHMVITYNRYMRWCISMLNSYINYLADTFDAVVEFETYPTCPIASSLQMIFHKWSLMTNKNAPGLKMPKSSYHLSPIFLHKICRITPTPWWDNGIILENLMGKIDDFEAPFQETSKPSKTESDPKTGSFEATIAELYDFITYLVTWTILWSMVKGSLGGETSVLRTFRMSGK